MKTVIFFALLTVASAGQTFLGSGVPTPGLGGALDTGISEHSRQEDGIGNYQFAYNEQGQTGGTTRSEAGDIYGRKQGSYSLGVIDGRQRVVDYVADELGFRAQVRTNEPGTAPQQPADVSLQAPDGAGIARASVQAAAPTLAGLAAGPAFGAGLAGGAYGGLGAYGGNYAGLAGLGAYQARGFGSFGGYAAAPAFAGGFRGAYGAGLGAYGAGVGAYGAGLGAGLGAYGGLRGGLGYGGYGYAAPVSYGGYSGYGLGGGYGGLRGVGAYGAGLGAYGGLRTSGLGLGGYGYAAPGYAGGYYAEQGVVNIPRPSSYAVNVNHLAATPQVAAPVAPIAPAGPLPAYKAAALTGGVKGY